MGELEEFDRIVMQQEALERSSVADFVEDLDDKFPVRADVIEPQLEDFPILRSSREYRISEPETYADTSLTVSFQNYLESDDDRVSIFGEFYMLRMSRTIYDEVDPTLIRSRDSFTAVIDVSENRFSIIENEKYVVNDNGDMIKPFAHQEDEAWGLTGLNLPTEFDEVRELVNSLD